MKKKTKPQKKAKSPKAKAVSKSSVGFTPVGDKVLVKPTPAETTTSFGIIIPDTAKEKPEQGTVIAVGSGKIVDGRMVPLSVKVGEKIMFNKYGFDEIKIGGVEYYIVSEQNIIGILS